MKRKTIGGVVGGVTGAGIGAYFGAGIGIAAAGTAIAGTWPVLLVGLLAGSVIGNQVGKRTKRKPPESKPESETTGGLKNAAAPEEKNGSSHFKDVLLKRIRKTTTKTNESSNMDRREQLRQRFNGQFERWEIELPIDAMETGVVWLIVKRGWTIWTRFDVEDDRERLDYYAMHRMTDDSHVRMCVDDDDVRLPAMLGWCVIPKGSTEAEAKAKYYAHNRSVAKLLEEKGFVMTNQAHGSAIVNRHLQTHPEAVRREEAGEGTDVAETDGDSEWGTSKTRK